MRVLNALALLTLYTDCLNWPHKPTAFPRARLRGELTSTAITQPFTNWKAHAWSFLVILVAVFDA